MPDPNTNDNLKERLDILSDLKKIYDGMNESLRDRVGLTQTLLDLESQISGKSKKEAEMKLKQHNIQQEIIKKRKELDNLVLLEGVEEENIRNILKDIKQLKLEEFNIQRQIGAEEKNGAKRGTLYEVLGLKKSIDLIKEFNENLKFGFGTAFFGLFVSLLKDFVGLFQQIDGAAAEFRTSMGFARDSTQILEKNIRAAYFELAQVGVTAKELYQAFQNISSVIGTSQSATKDMAKDMALMNVSLGVTKGESAEFALSMGIAARSTMDSQKNISLFTSKLSEAAGTNLSAVMSDVNKLTQSAYRFMIRSPIALAKAAVEAKKMGTSLESAAGAAKSLIEFKDSVEAEMKASVLLGESINLQRARELAYRKDLKGLNEEILDIAQKTRFEELDPIQQEAIAKALGKSESELGKMLQSQREMRRIRTDGSLAKEVAAYDKLKNATDNLVNSTAENARAQLAVKSNLEAIKAISTALSALYQHMFQPLVEAAAWALPKIATGIAIINEKFGKWAGILSGIITIFGIIWGAKGLGKLIGWVGSGIGDSAKSFLKGIAEGIKAFGGTDVLKGAAGIAIVAVSLIPLAYALKLMQGVDWKTFGVMAASLALMVAAVVALGYIMASPIGGPAIIAGALALVLVGASLIPAAYAFKLFAGALKELESVDLSSIASGLVEIGMAMFPLLASASLLPFAALGLGSFGLAMRFAVGPVERMAVASEQLGKGLKEVAESLAKIADLSISAVLSQFKDLSNVIGAVSKAVNELPDIKVERLQTLLITAKEAAAEGNKENVEIIKGLDDIRKAIGMLQSSLEAGGIPAIVYIDTTKLDPVMSRMAAFTGPRVPQPLPG